MALVMIIFGLIIVFLVPELYVLAVVLGISLVVLSFAKPAFRTGGAGAAMLLCGLVGWFMHGGAQQVPGTPQTTQTPTQAPLYIPSDEPTPIIGGSSVGDGVDAAAPAPVQEPEAGIVAPPPPEGLNK